MPETGPCRTGGWDARVTVANGNTAVATVTPNTAGVAYVILDMTDNGVPPLTSCRPVVLSC